MCSQALVPPVVVLGPAGLAAEIEASTVGPPKEEVLKWDNGLPAQLAMEEWQAHFCRRPVWSGSLYIVYWTEKVSVPMLEASRINYRQSHEVREQRLEHEEPSLSEKHAARECMLEFSNFLTTEAGNHALLSQVLRYRLSQNDSLMENLYSLVYLILKKPIEFTLSPQYGVSLWPHDIGFQRLPALETLLLKAPHHYFDDYLTETTTFVLFHTDFRFPDVFGHAFRGRFLEQSMRTLLRFGKSMRRLNLVKTILRCSLQMYNINEA